AGSSPRCRKTPRPCPTSLKAQASPRPLPARTSPNGCHNASAPCLAPPATPSTRLCVQARCA
ncbi:hypothetical protein LTR94_037745, partial [Friedmanniomyces endolithicus]